MVKKAYGKTLKKVDEKTLKKKRNMSFNDTMKRAVHSI